MQLTLHITKACNLRCTYCYYDHFPGGSMTEKTVMEAVDVALNESDDALAVTWFGGEPLLKKDLIRSLTPKIRTLAANRGRTATFKIPTNGHLLDDEFLSFCKAEGVFLSLSIDGDALGNAHRVDPLGRDAWQKSSEALRLVHEQEAFYATYSVVTPSGANRLADNIRYLHGRGSRMLIVALDHDAPWDETSMLDLAANYEALGDFWSTAMRAGHPFFLSPFDSTIESHTRPDPLSRTCNAGVTQLSVAPDGTLFPCVQFLEHSAYAIGHTHMGIDRERVRALMRPSPSTGCDGCAIRTRCGRDCTCVRFQTSGQVDVLSAVVCAHERILKPIADRVARALYEDRVPHFIQRHYNPAYAPLQAIETWMESR